jgi:hypothetical protein
MDGPIRLMLLSLLLAAVVAAVWVGLRSRAGSPDDDDDGPVF